MSRRRSLFWALTVPFVALTLLAGAAVGWLAFGAGTRAINGLTAQLVQSVVQRTGEAIGRQVGDSRAVLEVAFPVGIAAPTDIAGALDALRARFWVATGLQPALIPYIYYGGVNGQSFRVDRLSAEQGEVRLRTTATGLRTIHRFAAPDGPLGPGRTDPVELVVQDRPWFRGALRASGDVWSSVYVDIVSKQLVATRSRRVAASDGRIVGVVATDVPLRALDDFMRRLPVADTGFAFIVDEAGMLIATSRGHHVQTDADGRPQRVRLLDSKDRQMARVYEHVRTQAAGSSLLHPGSALLTGPVEEGGGLEVGYARVRDEAGMDWSVVVAVPQREYLQDVYQALRRSVLAAAIAAGSIILIGLWLLRRVRDDVRRLAAAASRIGQGDWGTPIGPQSTFELGLVADSFERMQSNLRTDRLTGLANREEVMQRLEARTHPRRRIDGAGLMVVLFVDLDGFKKVNDELGHDAGDVVLLELGQRLRRTVRDSDVVARWGGDEFVVLLDGVASTDAAGRIREQLRTQLRRPVSIEGHGERLLGGTIGMAIFPDDAADADGLIRHADQDMYRLKRAGRDPTSPERA